MYHYLGCTSIYKLLSYPWNICQLIHITHSKNENNHRSVDFFYNLYNLTSIFKKRKKRRYICRYFLFNATYSTQIIETVAFKIKMFPCKNLLKYFIKIYDFFQVSGTVGTFTSNSDNVQSINLSSQDSGNCLHFFKTD